jgi:hypothetical protein
MNLGRIVVATYRIRLRSPPIGRKAVTHPVDRRQRSAKDCEGHRWSPDEESDHKGDVANLAEWI